MERWGAPPRTETSSINYGYNTVDEEKEKDYEDPDYYYSGRRSGNSDASTDKIVGSPPPPGGAVPPAPMSTMGRIPTTHLAIHHHPNKKKRASRWKLICTALVLGVVCVILVASIIAFIFIGARAQNLWGNNGKSKLFEDIFPSQSSVGVNEVTERSAEMEISCNHLLTLLITKRKLCLFEAATDNIEESQDAFFDDHIENAHLLFHGNLTHAGVPVHPLQLQRVARSLGIDSDCHVVIYDRGHMVWSTYAVWIFKLFGHQKVSLLSGGYNAWKSHQSRSAQYRTEAGPGLTQIRQGNLLSQWNSSVVITFDDVFTNTELGHYDVVDAQTKEEYDGTATGALYGHIRGATNIPIEIIYDWNSGNWLPSNDLLSLYRSHSLSRHRGVIVYCSTSVRASMVWWSLTRLNYPAKIYFGGWPEWVIRAPDYLKVLTTQ